MTEHSRFRFDAANAPTYDTQTIDHGRVRISADERIRVINCTIVCGFLLHDFGQVLEIDLVNDPDARRNYLERFKGLLPPF